jgi:anti-sigma B factor antagonist
MNFSVEQNDPAVISLSGSVLGGADALEFTKTVGDLVREGESFVVVDVSGVDLMNSSGLGMLVGASTSLRSANGSLVVAGANQKLQNLFKMTRLDSVLAQYPSREEAVAAYRRN